MLDAIRRLFGDNTSSVSPAHEDDAPPDVRLAACALLLELAHVDGDFSDVERARISEVLQRHFDVDATGAQALMDEAYVASRKSVDDFTFTRQLVKGYTLAQRLVLAELMWQVVLADGELAERESYLMRKLANLLQLEPAFLAQARRKTEEGEQ
jgi:uncharacterized tellurite resistance protein B-like protein